MRYYWLLRRVGLSVLRVFVTLFIVLLVSFTLVRLSPYSPITAILLQSHGAQLTNVKAQIEFYYGLYPSGPLYLQFLNYISAVLQGNFGHSIISQLPVASLISEALPWTLLIVVSSVVISFAIGTIVGMLMAYRRRGVGDTSVTTFFTITSSLPIYFVALVLFIFLTFSWPVFPHAGAYDIAVTPGLSFTFVASILTHSVLPILALVIVNLGGWALSMRANTISVLGEDYVLAAETRGIGSFKTATTYVGRNAILPQFTSLILALGFSFVGSVFVEEIFSYPGMGYMLINAVTLNDYSVLMGVFMTYIVAVVLGLVIADFIYGLLDPRVRR